MEDLFSLKYGIAGICILLTISVLVNVGKFVLSLRKEKDSLSDAAIKKLTDAVESNTMAASHLDKKLGDLERSIGDLPKFRIDMRRFYAAIKEVAGDRWPAIRDEIMKDDFTL
jgi:hypothetical protein